MYGYFYFIIFCVFFSPGFVFVIFFFGFRSIFLLFSALISYLTSAVLFVNIGDPISRFNFAIGKKKRFLLCLFTLLGFRFRITKRTILVRQINKSKGGE